MKTLDTKHEETESHTESETGAPAPIHHVPLGRISAILAVFIVVGAIAGFIPRLLQRHEAQNDIATLAATTVTLVSWSLAV